MDDAVQAKMDANMKGNFMKSTKGKILFSLIAIIGTVKYTVTKYIYHH